MSLLKTKKDRELFQKWNKKLEKFDDCNVEDFSLPEPALKVWHNFKFKQLSKDQYEHTVKYYDNAVRLLNEHKFKRSLHRKIWEYHTEGYSNREIEKLIKNKRSRSWIDNLVKELKCLMLK